MTPYDAGNSERNSRGLSAGNISGGCYYCHSGKLGQFKVNCNKRKSDLPAMGEKNGAPQPPTN